MRINVTKDPAIVMKSHMVQGESISVQGQGNVKVNVAADPQKKINVNKDDTDVRVSAEVRKPYVISEEKKYMGAYAITPEMNEIVLRTKDKVMTGNVTIHRIPYKKYPNDYGTTLEIG